MKVRITTTDHTSDDPPDVDTQKWNGTLLEFVLDYMDTDEESLRDYDNISISDDLISLWSDDDYWFEVV